MEVQDPRRIVEAPVRRELTWLVVRGVALVGVIGAIAACPVLFALDVGTDNALAMAVPVILIAYGLIARVRRMALGAASERARAAAWRRAREVDVDDAMLGRMISLWVPLGLLIALGALLWPHFTDKNPALACSWVVLGLPPMVFAWLFASSTWLDVCRDDLARAEGESDALFRRYWSNVGH